MTKKVKCHVCGKQFEKDWKAGGVCPVCNSNKKKLRSHLFQDMKKGVANTLSKTPDDKDKSWWNNGITFSNNPRVNFLLQIVAFIVFLIIMNMFFW